MTTSDDGVLRERLRETNRIFSEVFEGVSNALGIVWPTKERDPVTLIELAKARIAELQEAVDVQARLKWEAYDANKALTARALAAEARIAEPTEMELRLESWIVRANKAEEEVDTLRGRIAELDAPVLPEEVASLVAHIRKHWALCNGPEFCGRCPACQAAALLTRLSTVTEEDVERVAMAIWIELGGKDKKALDSAARAVLTAYLGG